MLARQTLRQHEFSFSDFVAPRSTFTRDGDSSSTLAFSGLPISSKRRRGDVGVHLLHQQNPALLISGLRHVVDSTSYTDNTLVLTQNILHSIQEEGYNNITNIHQQRRAAYSNLSKGNSRVREAGFAFPSFSIQQQPDNVRVDHLDHVRLPLSKSTIRSLTSPSIKISTMTTMVSAPGTPPELTESQSSKSDSYASQLSSPEEYAGGNMNFEEINLDDDKHSNAYNGKSRTSDNQGSTRSNGRSVKRPALATLQTQQTSYQASVENGSKSATNPNLKRNFTSPAVPPASPNGQRTHSESPALHKAKSSSRLGQFAHTPATSLAIPGRRGSCQPVRKTIHEIEAEYHDSDDELPDDASLFNVPVSPFVSHARGVPRSARSSAQGSPERDSPALSPGPIPLSHARTAPDAPSKRSKGSKTLPKQRLTPRASSSQMKQPKSASTSPRLDMRFTRTRSWADLDHEARIISEKLDFHQEASSKSAASASTSYRSSAPGAIPLPPIQRGTLDFMPASKEKEAVLSRTRPSWLPPKDPKEEKRHLEQYKKMMQASLEADKKREEKLKDRVCTSDSTRESLHRIWTYYIEPTTDLSTIDTRVNDLCWRGIPPKLRGRVWQRRVGNSLGLTLNSYTMAVQRVKEIKSRPIEKLAEQEKIMQEWFSDIERDAETAFPDISIFKRNGPQWQDLINVCEAYATYRGDIGYTYGMQLVAALVLLQVPDPAEAFILMANCLNKAMPLAFQTGDIAATSRTFGKVKATLEVKFPGLHSYLFNSQQDGGLAFTGEELFDAMFRTLFANGLDLDRLCRVWDIWVFEGDRYLVRTAVALLGILQTQIFDLQGDIDLRRRNIQEMLGWGPFNRTNSGYWKLDALGDGDSFVEEIRAAGRLNCAGR
ncbi:hypothetical protein OHC33_006268 [Knufia fluminis]|uniref:Rab-GAP TBC domain-containing protein n=1 Tax=Knufia fluminis TaxID=191047 RepID=A0AAN8F760_9EURO|nr:hypothetical protein OHC33_006268 [Knufia fluminis]